ncbi:MAG: hypothetical protein ACOX6N_05460 [Patescibacteria group bacterium]|jgi:hypothetical protein
MAIIQQSKITPKIMLSKDIQTIFTALNETRILMVKVENIGQFFRHVYFYTETDELISEYSLSANASISFKFSDNEYIVGEGIKAKQSVEDEDDIGNDVEVAIHYIETIASQ